MISILTVALRVNIRGSIDFWYVLSSSILKVATRTLIAAKE